jgi:hypothetical protein
MGEPYVGQDLRLRARADMLPTTNNTRSDIKQELTTWAHPMPTIEVAKAEPVEPTSHGASPAIDNNSKA